MVESHWESLRGKELRYHDHTWELSGDVDVRQSGKVLAVEARQVDDVRHAAGMLYFVLESPPKSLNPGNLGEHFETLERADSDPSLVVEKGRRTYRYGLKRLTYQ